MSSGQKRLVFNTRERAISDDPNRLQSFLAASMAEYLRWASVATSDEGGGQTAQGATTNPLTAIILGGLWARPEIGTVNLFVEPGVVALINPEPSPSTDDSPCKVISDPGVQTAGTLTLTPAPGSTRIDIIECSRTVVTTESDNRDVYDPVTGLFTPVLVNKVVTDQLTYRIRLGTPGGGIPATASGWLPLAVASVPAAAATWNDCIVWDVRPLMADLVHAPTQMQTRFPHRPMQYGTLRLNGAARELRGAFEAELNQWRVGGEVGSALSGLATGMLDLAGSDVIEPGFAATPDTPWFLYACFPGGLPRWARYSPSSSGQRIPLPFRGIPVFSQKTPNTARGIRTSSTINIPTPLGIGGGTTSNVALVTGAFDSTTTCLSSIMGDGWTKLSGPVTTINPAAGATTDTIRFDLADNTHFPLGASMIRVRLSFTAVHAGAGTNCAQRTTMNVLDSGSIVLANEVRRIGNIVSDTNARSYVQEFDVPIDAVASMPTGTAQTHRIQFVTQFLGAVTVSAWSSQTLEVLGWRMGW